MAITKIGPPLSGIRGTIGGITYSENRTSTYARAWAPPSNPKTPKQSTQRSNIGAMPALWNLLTSPQQDAWRTFADLPAQELTNPLGETYFASGYNWFVKCNTRLMRVGRTTITAVPTQARPTGPTNNGITVTPNGTDSLLDPSGPLFVSTFTPGFPGSNAIDGNPATWWQTLAPNTTGWIQPNFPADHSVKHIALTGESTLLTAAPGDFQFQIFIAAAWQTLFSVTGESWSTVGPHHYYFPNPENDNQYRLFVTANQGHATLLALAEIEMFEGDTGTSVIYFPQDEFTDSPNYDLILHIAQGPTPGLANAFAGFYETLAIIDPGRWFALFQDQLSSIFGNPQPNRTWFAELHRQTQEGIRSQPTTARAQTTEP